MCRNGECVRGLLWVRVHHYGAKQVLSENESRHWNESACSCAKSVTGDMQSQHSIEQTKAEKVLCHCEGMAITLMQGKLSFNPHACASRKDKFNRVKRCQAIGLASSTTMYILCVWFRLRTQTHFGLCSTAARKENYKTYQHAKLQAEKKYAW